MERELWPLLYRPAREVAETFRQEYVQVPYMSRRFDRASLNWVLRAIEQALRKVGGPPAWLASMDGKPLRVGAWTKGPDARFGRSAGAMAKGHKLHTVWPNDGLPEASRGRGVDAFFIRSYITRGRNTLSRG